MNSVWKCSERVICSHSDSGFVAVNTADGEPRGQIQHVLQNFLIQLQVGQLTFSLQRAQVDLIWRKVLRKPVTGTE